MAAHSLAEAHLDGLVDQLHQSRLRVWSIIITFFGDTIAPRGGVMWLSTFRPVAARLRIEAGTLGAAMSRLTADGWLARERRGRHSLYRLDERGRTVFEDAAHRVYGDEVERPWNQRWSIVVLPGGESPPEGFARIDHRTWARPEWGPPVDPPPAAIARFTAHSDDLPGLHALVHEAWDLAPVAAAYQRHVERFLPLLDALEAGHSLDPLSALSARTLLVHGFRRIVLKDPELPDALRPPEWPGHPARQQTAALYRALLDASEHWLDAPERTPEGPLPRPRSTFYKRFGGLKILQTGH